MGAALLACLALLAALACGGPQLTGLLRYERTAIAQGEWWRLISGHWVHLGPRHLLPDAAGLVLLWALYARALRPGSWLLAMACATVAIDAGLWWGQPDVQWYVGISGLLHGAWAAGSAAVALKGGREGWVMLAALAAKLAVEHYSGTSLVTSGFPVVSTAHLYGALGALLAVVALALVRLARAHKPL
jgi:rhomboid family GlyGly-CTERM serine protease